MRNALTKGGARAGLVAVAALALGGCDHAAPPVPLAEEAGNTIAYVTGEAAADLDSKGRFRTAGQQAPPLGSITPARARQLAVAYAERFGSGLRGPLERQHGGEIRFDALKAGERVYLTDSRYGPQPPSMHPGLRKHYGPYYIVHLYEDARPALAAAVSVANVEFKEDESGTIRFYELVGNDIHLFGVPAHQTIQFPMPPEEATRLAYVATGRKATKVPALIREPEPMTPFASRWRLVMESPATFADAQGNQYVTDEIYIGYQRKLSVGITEKTNPAARSISGAGVAVRTGIPAGYVDVTLQK